MLNNIEAIAAKSELRLSCNGEVWACDEDHPHITTFRYDLLKLDADSDEVRMLGCADGYRITHDWTVDSDLQIWEEADSLDGDAVRYVEALIREVRACQEVFDFAPDVTSAQRITIVRHVEPARETEPLELTRGAVACLAMMDAPVFMLVDAWPRAEERRSAVGRMKGRIHFPGLLQMGFVRMVASRFLWGWNRESADALMHGYSYSRLRSAKRAGALDAILASPLSDEVYGVLPRGAAEMADVPTPEGLMDE